MALRLWWSFHIQEVVSSSPAVDKNFSFRNSSFRPLQLETATANEINHDLYLVDTLFQIKVRYKNVWLSSPVVHVNKESH